MERHSVDPSERKSGSSSYRLHLVSVSPLNYSSYLFAIQNNTKLLSDPRLKKLLDNQKSSPVFNKQSLPFPPELKEMLKLDPKEAASKMEALNVPRPAGNVAKALQEIRAATAQRKAAANIRSKQKDDEGSTPPYSSGARTPPYAETGGTPPYTSGGTPPYTGSPEQSTSALSFTVLQQDKPTTSHLPRSVTDPRLARLHQPTRSGMVTKKKVVLTIKNEKEQLPQIEEIKSPDPASRRNSDEQVEKTVEIVKGNSKNRRGSLDYASPLNAYSGDARTTSKYSSYNRRPQARAPLVTTPSEGNNRQSEVTVPQNIGSIPMSLAETKETAIAEIFTDEILAINQSLKEVFKTIDPTASPFC